jgi:hypothetical protein
MPIALEGITKARWTLRVAAPESPNDPTGGRVEEAAPGYQLEPRRPTPRYEARSMRIGVSPGATLSMTLPKMWRLHLPPGSSRTQGVRTRKATISFTVKSRPVLEFTANRRLEAARRHRTRRRGADRRHPRRGSEDVAFTPNPGSLRTQGCEPATQQSRSL